MAKRREKNTPKDTLGLREGTQGRNKLGRGVSFSRLGFRPCWQVYGWNPLDGGEVGCPAVSKVSGIPLRLAGREPPAGMRRELLGKLPRGRGVGTIDLLKSQLGHSMDLLESS